jgi:uncharacterized membrane protein YfcA
MNKTVLLVFATIFGAAGSYVPFLFGDQDIFSAWSILGGMIGGFFGIWLGVKVSKALS